MGRIAFAIKQQPSNRPLLFVIGIFLLALPFFLPSYGVSLVTRVLIFSIFAMSLDLLTGYGGLPSFGHAAFFGAAGYTVGILATKVLASGTGMFWLAMPAGIFVAAGMGAAFGSFLVRTRGIFFFMVTLAMGEMIRAVAWTWRSLTGGDDGMPGIHRPDLGLPLPMTDTTNFYFLVLLFFALSFYLLFRIVVSPFGHALVGIRENESRMRSLGHNVWAYKYYCFILSAAFAGLAGVLSVYFDGFISPATLGSAASGVAIFMLIIGGAGTLFGPVIGAIVVTFLEYIVSMVTVHWVMILGIGYVLSVLYFREGIGGYLVKRWKGLRIGI